MRLTPIERQTLRAAAQTCFDAQAVVRLFGSRLDDSRKGGDIDLYITTNLTNPSQIARAHSRFLAQVYAAMGEQKIDVLIDYPPRQQDLPVYRVAREQGVVL
jgi:hypothetical protein